MHNKSPFYKRAAMVLCLLLILLTLAYVFRIPVFMRVLTRIRGKQTLEQRLETYGPAARSRLKTVFGASGISYPPEKLVFVGLKQEKTLQVYALNGEGFNYVMSYPILAASGTIGPKLREGDRQVPEGVYRITYLNPNSLYHLALRVGYPNDFDQEKGRIDGRVELGQDIMIHGSNCSIGCLAMGDQASEDLFVLAADTGITNIQVILSPVDFRKTDVDRAGLSLPVWIDELYTDIKDRLKGLPAPMGN